MITGRTEVFGIIADPIAQVRTPRLMNAELAASGIDGVLVPFHVAPDTLAVTVVGLRQIANLRGYIVTVPHKEAIVPLLDELTPQARAVGAVNIVRQEGGRLIGHQSDGEGFVRGLAQANHAVAGRRVFVAGAGGAAAGIAFALAAHGAARITLFNRTRSRAEALVARVRGSFPACDIGVGGPDPSGHDIAVNATSAGLHPTDPLPFDIAAMAPPMLAAEAIIDPAETAFLREAAARGCATHPGEPMLAAQIKLMQEFMRGERTM